jgi:hypothetical protein
LRVYFEIRFEGGRGSKEKRKKEAWSLREMKKKRKIREVTRDRTLHELGNGLD